MIKQLAAHPLAKAGIIMGAMAMILGANTQGRNAETANGIDHTATSRNAPICLAYAPQGTPNAGQPVPMPWHTCQGQHTTYYGADPDTGAAIWLLTPSAPTPPIAPTVTPTPNTPTLAALGHQGKGMHAQRVTSTPHHTTPKAHKGHAHKGIKHHHKGHKGVKRHHHSRKGVSHMAPITL